MSSLGLQKYEVIVGNAFYLMNGECYVMYGNESVLGLRGCFDLAGDGGRKQSFLCGDIFTREYGSTMVCRSSLIVYRSSFSSHSGGMSHQSSSSRGKGMGLEVRSRRGWM